MPEEDIPEAAALEAAAEWRLRMVDANPHDAASAAAARLLRKLADDVRALQGSALMGEFHALCGWLDESDNITHFSLLAHEFRSRIGIDRHPETGEDYLRALTGLAREAM